MRSFHQKKSATTEVAFDVFAHAREQNPRSKFKFKIFAIRSSWVVVPVRWRWLPLCILRTVQHIIHNRQFHKKKKWSSSLPPLTRLLLARMLRLKDFFLKHNILFYNRDRLYTRTHSDVNEKKRS